MHLLPIVDGTGASCGVAGSPLPAVPPVDPATCRGTFAMVSLGCPKNLVDGERMQGMVMALFQTPKSSIDLAMKASKSAVSSPQE